MRTGSTVALAAAATAMLAGTAAKAQGLQCPDGETWEVDKGALRQVISSLPSYLNQRQPVLINLQALGANSGELLITEAGSKKRARAGPGIASMSIVTDSGPAK